MCRITLTLILLILSKNIALGQNNNDCHCSEFSEIERAIECLAFQLIERMSHIDTVGQTTIQVIRKSNESIVNYTIDKILLMLNEKYLDLKIYDPHIQKLNNEIDKKNIDDGIEVHDNETMLSDDYRLIIQVELKDANYAIFKLKFTDSDATGLMLREKIGRLSERDRKRFTITKFKN